MARDLLPILLYLERAGVRGPGDGLGRHLLAPLDVVVHLVDGSLLPETRLLRGFGSIAHLDRGLERTKGGVYFSCINNSLKNLRFVKSDLS